METREIAERAVIASPETPAASGDDRVRTRDFMRRSFAGRRDIWWLLVAGLVLVRMGVVARDEIVPIDYDSSNYAYQSRTYLARPPLGKLPEQPPGLACLAIVVSRLGMPFKLALDAIFVAVCLAIYQFIRLAANPLAGLLVFAWLLFNPWFMGVSVLFMTEPLTAILVLALGVSAAPFVTRDPATWTWRTAMSGAWLSAYFVVVRQEYPLLVCYWIGVAALTALRNWSDFRAVVRGQIRWRWLLVLTPIACMFLGIQTLKRLHEWRYGVFTTCTADAPGVRKLLDALYSIEPDQKIRYAPVTRQSLAAACDASPTLNEMRDRLLDQRNSYYQIAKTKFGLEGEFGTWLNWLISTSAGGLNAGSNQRLLRAAAEIRMAQHEARLPRRRAWFPMDPLIDQWIGDLWPNLCRAVSDSWRPSLNISRSVGQFSKRRVHDNVQRGYFDDGLMRRHGTRPESRLRIHGCRAEAAETRFQSVRILETDEAGEARAFITQPPDGQPGFSLDLSPHEGTRGPSQIELHFGPKSGANRDQASVDLKNASGLQSIAVVVRPSATESETWLIRASYPDDAAERPNPAQWWLRRNYFRTIPFWLLALGAIGLAAPPRPQILGQLFWFLAAAGGLYLGRSLFYSLLHAWTHWGLGRYVETNHLLLLLLAAIAAYLLGACGRAAIPGFAGWLKPPGPVSQKRTNS
jgi:hypothetical protein